MPAEDDMTIEERRKYLRRVRDRYWAVDRVDRGMLLTEAESVTGMHRKSLIRLVRGPTLDRKPRVKVRGRTYGPDVEDAIRVVWESLDYVCAERLTPALAPTARHLESFNELVLTADLEAQLGRISRATVQWLMRRLRQDTPRLPRRGPERANRLTRVVPMERLSWKISEPGHFEVDPSAWFRAGSRTPLRSRVRRGICPHLANGRCGHRLERASSSARAHSESYGRRLPTHPGPVTLPNPQVASRQRQRVLQRPHDPLLGENIVGLKLSRSRPYRKNDNRIVEQKNDSLVRNYLGYDRIDTAAQCRALNALYNRMGVFYNLFQLVLHLIGKTIVNGRLQRKWDKARPPYRRLQDSKIELRHGQQDELAAIYSQTNPLQLRRRIHQELERLWDQPGSQRNKGQLVDALASEGRRGGLRISWQGRRMPTYPQAYYGTENDNKKSRKTERREVLPGNIFI